MKIYLMQHGRAMSKEENPERPLTEQGKDDVGRVSALLVQAGSQLSEIRHSGKRRAEDTANIVAQHLQMQEKVIAVEGTNPLDDAIPVAEALQKQTEPVMLVGHLPFLSKLVSYLLIGNTEETIVQFQMGGVICLVKQDDTWAVAWMTVPDVVK